MKNKTMRIVRLLTVGLIGLTTVAHGESPTWAKKATAFPFVCRERADFRKCKPLRIPSPDNKSSVEVVYKKDDDTMFASLRITTPGRGIREVGVPCSNGNDDLLWSPNSKSFFINGGCGSAISGFVVSVYFVDTAEIEGIDFTQEAMHDMVRSFPPCKAVNHDPTECKVMQANREYYNMSGIDWLPDSSGIAVMSEVPCTPRYGGIMCQVMGYELEVPSGKILKRLDAKQFKLKWQKSMAWKFRIPDPPEYQRETVISPHPESKPDPR